MNAFLLSVHGEFFFLNMKQMIINNEKTLVTGKIM